LLPAKDFKRRITLHKSRRFSYCKRTLLLIWL
jgi:hypothetical protein